MTTTAYDDTPRVGVPVRALYLVLLAVVLVMTFGALPGVRERPGPIPFYDDWLQNLGYVLAAGGAVWRVLVSSERRLLWAVVSAALVLRAAGFIHTIFVLERRPVYPSLSDAFWIGSSLCLVAALLLAARVQSVHRSRIHVLDAILGGVTAAAVAWTFLEPTMVRQAPPGLPTDVVVINLTYPLLDVALLVLIMTMFGQSQGRVSRSIGLLVVGVMMFAVVDAVFLYRVSVGTWGPGSTFTPLSILGTGLISLAAWLPSRRPQEPDPTTGAALSIPAGLALTCVAVLAYDAVREVPAVPVLLASLGVVIAIVRGYLTFTGDRADTRIVIAAKDEELERFRALVEASSDFIGIADLSGGALYLNPAGRAMIGYGPDQPLAGITIADTLYEAEQRRAAEVERPQIMARGFWRGESLLRHQYGGRDVPVMKNSFLVRHPESGEPWLLATIQRDISDLRRARDELRRIADERQVLLQHLTEAQEAERARIAADVHDDSVQALAAVDLQLGLLHRRLDGHSPEVDETLAMLRQSVTRATERLRHLLFDLDSPAQRDDLVTVLEDAAGHLFGQRVQWRVEAEEGVDLPEAQRVTAHRMAKEAMINVVKHARAEHVVVGVRGLADGVEVTVADDGVGLPPGELEHRPGHRGLADMHDRAMVAGGWIRIERARPAGTTVRIWMPSAPTARDQLS